MRIWAAVPFLDAERAPALAAELAATGIEGVAISDHLCVPMALRSVYPYTGRRAVLPSDTPFADPLIVIAAMAVAAPQLRFMTNVVVAPLHHPIPLARAVATVAATTNGRIDLGVGAGWMREEFDAIGQPFDGRGERLDEIVGLLRSLWTGKPVRHHGTHIRFEELSVRPTPPRRVPILIGGQSPAALRRAARIGDGWIGLGLGLDKLAENVARLAALRQEQRATSDFAVRASLGGALDADTIARAEAIGVTGLVVEPRQVVNRTRLAAGDVPAFAQGLARLVAMTQTGRAA